MLTVVIFHVTVRRLLRYASDTCLLLCSAYPLLARIAKGSYQQRILFTEEKAPNASAVGAFISAHVCPLLLILYDTPT